MHKPGIGIFFFVFFLSAFSFAFQPEGYKVKFRIYGLRDTVCLVANYYGNGAYIKDTLRVDRDGRCFFEAPADLLKGVYILVITDKNYFDFVINNDRKFTMETDVSDPSGRMKITGSPENQEFYDYLHYNQEKFREIQALQAKIQAFESNPDSVTAINKRITGLNDTIIAYKLNLVKERLSSFLAMLINAMKEPVIPEIPILANGRKDSTFAYRYYKHHYWDDMDLTDNRLIRTPVFHNKLKKYFDQVVVQQPDSIIKEATILVEKARPDPEMFKYIVWFLTYHYENSEIMGFDKVWVHIVDTYYITGQVTWVSAPVMENIVKKANRTRSLLIGKIAPNMIMVDTNNQLVSMYNLKSDLLILLFWDPDCGHCEKELPQLKELYDKYKEAYGLEIFAVCSDTSIVKWKEYIKKKKMTWINVDGPRTLTGDYHTQYDVQTTPVIYILDRDKKIIAKRLQTDQIELFLKNYRKKTVSVPEK
ncbi:MAG: thioredoxin-like domain-containing protein [bacterium]